MSIYDGKIPEGCEKMYKEKILNLFSAEHKVGKIFNIYNPKYGEITIVATRTAGNLVLQHGFYPVAYIQPNTLVAILNNIPYNPNSQFSLVQKLIRENFTIIECEDPGDLIEFVDEYQNTDWSNLVP